MRPESACRANEALGTREALAFGDADGDHSGLVDGLHARLNARRPRHLAGSRPASLTVRLFSWSKRLAGMSGRTGSGFDETVNDFAPFKKTHVFRNGLCRVKDAGI